MSDPTPTPPASSPAGSTDPTTTAGRLGNRGGGEHKLRHFVIVFLVTLLVAIGIVWASGAFRPAPRVVLITSTEDPYWDRVIAGAQAAAQQFDVKLDVVRSKGEEKVQSQAIRDALSASAKGIAISPVDAAAQTNLLREAAGKTTLITFDSDAPDSNRLAFVGTDNYLAGRLCAQVVRDALPEGGDVLISVGSVEKENGRLRRQGLIDNLLDRPIDPNRAAEPLDQPIKAGKYNIVGTLIDGTDPARCTTLTADALNKNPNLKLIVGLYGYTTPATLDALKQAGKLGKIKIVGFDEAEPTLAGIEQGNVYGTLVQDQYNMGYDAVRLLAEVMNKVAPTGSANRSEYLPCRPITSADAVSIPLIAACISFSLSTSSTYCDRTRSKMSPNRSSCS